MKRFPAFILVLTMLFSFLPMTVLAAEPVVETAAVPSGSCGDGVIWRLESGTLTIGGAGIMDSYPAVGSAPWYNYGTQITSVVIGDNVGTIGGGNSLRRRRSSDRAGHLHGSYESEPAYRTN